MSEKDQEQFDDLLREQVGRVNLSPPEGLRARVEADFFRVHRRRRLIWFWLLAGGIAGMLVGLLFFVLPTDDLEVRASRAETAKTLTEETLTTPTPAEVQTMREETKPGDRAGYPWEASERAQEVAADTPQDPEGPSDPALGSNDRSSSARLAPKGGVDQQVAGASTPVIPPVTDDDPTQPSTTPAFALSAREADNAVFEIGQPEVGKMPLRSIDPWTFHDPELLVPGTQVAYEPPVQRIELPKPGCGKWIIALSAGAGLSYRTLQSNVHHQLVEHKNSSEHAAVSTSAGVNVVYTFLGRSGIKTGVNYLRVGERYHFENDHAAHETTNTYDYFNFDLKFNQTLVCRPRWRLDLAAGTKFNLLNSAQSSWLDPSSFEATAHSNEDNASPFREYNLVWSADVSAYYFIGRKLFVGMTIEADRFQNSVYKDKVELDQRPYALQGYLNIGLKF